MNLVIDLGNSRLKWALADGPVLVEAGTIDYGPAFVAGLDAAWNALSRPGQVLAAAVGDPHHALAVAEAAQRRWGLALRTIAVPAEGAGVVNRYHEPARLGADRWAALVAARAHTTDACCIASCGTAVTIDTLNGDGEFLGGVIFAGLGLQRRALTTGTAGIPAGNGAGGSCFARSTAEAVASGVLFSAVGAIERVYESACAELGPGLRLILTGGDAPAVLPHLRVLARVEPHLVLQGLALLAAEDA